MATYRKRTGPRGDSWRVEVWVAGIRESATFRSKAAARQWAGEREHDLGKGGAATTLKTLRDVLAEYGAKVSPAHKGARWEKIRLAKITRDFDGVERPLRDLTAADIAAWRDKRLASVQGPSVAREMGLLRAALHHACREWQWLPRQKLDDLRGARKPKQAPPRRRRISPDEAAAIVAALGYAEGEPVTTVSQRVAVAFLLALETAMRCGELCGITKADMELDRRFVRLPKTKNGDAREVPLSAEAVRLFKRLPGHVLNLSTAQVDALYRAARPDATIRFHDSRAEALTRLSAKVDVLTLARIAGHRDPRSLMIYYRESAEDIAARL